MKRAIRAAAVLLLTVCLLWSTADAGGLQACHRVSNTFTIITQKNKSQIELWHAETALPEVTDEINALAESWADEIGPSLKSAGNNGKKNSKLQLTRLIMNCLDDSRVRAAAEE